ncbi:hypothetical protein K402DRAFT_403547 [Aulographum hederae CBS 113979]|uniref:DUF8035 domain-containing protein n=1 Tax=Aulographum hederae CBS 113979 TaxID=1176131 RepID=A0A6G1H338_9PEZI|nr:hypothetical protein K402DRAFT_403547 [Aulographum hederae CBS 113979]
MSVHTDPRRMAERWDREKFESFRTKTASPPAAERESYHFEEHDRFRGGGRRDIAVEDRVERRMPPGLARHVSRERIFEDDAYAERFAPTPRRRTDYIPDEALPAEAINRALAPYRRRSIVEREFEPPVAPVPPRRPMYLRRQSSLDTFDRRPVRPYEDYAYGPPVGGPIPLPVRRRSPSRPRYREPDYDEIHYREAYPSYPDYRDIMIKRERSLRRRDRSHRRSKKREESVRSSSTSTSSFEEIEDAKSVKEEMIEETKTLEDIKSVHEDVKSIHEESPPSSTSVGKKGRTRMPKRLVHKGAIIQLGYPFEEEDDFIVIKRALQKEHIDEIIKLSEDFKENKTVYKVEETKVIEEVHEVEEPPPESHHSHHTTIIVPPPPPASAPPSHHTAPPSHHTPHHTERAASAAPSHHTTIPPPPISLAPSHHTSRHSRHTTVIEVPPPPSHHTSHHTTVIEAPPPPPSHHTSHHTTVIEAPPPPPSSHHTAPPPPASVAPSHHTTIIEAPPPPSSHHTTIVEPPPPSVHSHHTTVVAPAPPSSHHSRATSPAGTTHWIEEREEISNHIHGPLTVVAPPRSVTRSDRDIKAEIRALEAERRAVRLEREADEKRWLADRLRDTDIADYEIVERRESRDRDVVRIEKDRKVMKKDSCKASFLIY